HPEWVKRIRDAGHTIGTHSNSHPLNFRRMPLERAEFEIQEGIANVTAALGNGPGPAPFFRIPGLERADGVERYAASQNIQIWSADFVADDWTKIGPGQVYSRALQRIEAAHKGILLLHDIQVKTAEALPGLLRELKRRGYRIVRVVPATPDRPKTATDPSQWLTHTHQASHSPVFLESEPELPAPNPASFGFDVGSNSISYLHKISLVRDPAWQPLTLPDPLRSAPVAVSTWPSGFEVTRDGPNLPAQFNLSTAARSDNARHWGPARIHAAGDLGDSNVIAVNEIQRLLESLPEENVPESGAPANSVMPRGAFP
ncbi:MAG: polysaccharide deacetylase family protein, partial [Bradyrhizobiaceae bacterium]|nr:polysaccharide deacetylase family protein [Bradyrhizobiaceae bacterium]